MVQTSHVHVHEYLRGLSPLVCPSILHSIHSSHLIAHFLLLQKPVLFLLFALSLLHLLETVSSDTISS